MDSASPGRMRTRRGSPTPPARMSRVALAMTLSLVWLTGCDLGSEEVTTASSPATESPGFEWRETDLEMPSGADPSIALVTDVDDGYVALGRFFGGEHQEASAPSGLLVWRSADGLEWSRLADPIGIPDSFETQQLLESEAGLLAVGRVWDADDESGPWHARVYRSHDGVSWTDITPDVSLLEGESLYIQGAAAGGGGFVITGSIEFDPTRPPLEIEHGSSTLKIDEGSGTLEIVDGAGRVVHTESADALQPDVTGEDGVTVFHPESGEQLFVIPWDLVNQHELDYWSLDDEQPETDAPSGSLRDQGQIYSTDGLVHLGADTWSQTVRAGMTGRLAGIQIFLETETPTPVAFDLTVASGADPSAAEALFAERVTVMTTGVYTWDLATPDLLFDRGEVFSFSLTAGVPGAVVAANDRPGYAGGELYQNGVPTRAEPTDLAFITYMWPPDDGDGIDETGRPGEPLALDVDGFSFVLFGYEPERPSGATYEIREQGTDILVAAGDVAQLARRPPPRFTTADGAVLIEFATWDEFWSAHNAAIRRVEETMDSERYSRPLAKFSTDAENWSDIELTSGVAANQTPHVGVALWGRAGWSLRGFLENADLGTHVEVRWTSSDGIDWQISMLPDEARDVRDVTPTSFGFLGIGETPTGAPAVLRSSNGETWELALSIEAPSGGFVWFDTLASGDLGSFVVGVTDVEAPGAGPPPLHGDDDDEADFARSESSLYFTRDGVTFFELDDALLSGRSIENVVVAEDVILVLIGRSGDVEFADASLSSPSVIVGRPTS